MYFQNPCCYLNCFKIFWPHVFGAINSESRDTKVNKIIDVVSNLAPNIILAPIKIIEANNTTVADLCWVLEVANLTVRMVEVCCRKWNSRIIQTGAIESGATSSSSRTA